MWCKARTSRGQHPDISHQLQRRTGREASCAPQDVSAINYLHKHLFPPFFSCWATCPSSHFVILMHKSSAWLDCSCQTSLLLWELMCIVKSCSFSPFLLPLYVSLFLSVRPEIHPYIFNSWPENKTVSMTTSPTGFQHWYQRKQGGGGFRDGMALGLQGSISESLVNPALFWAYNIKNLLQKLHWWSKCLATLAWNTRNYLLLSNHVAKSQCIKSSRPGCSLG